VDPDSLNQDPDMDPDPAFQVNPDPIRIHGFDYQKLKKKKIFDEFFSSKIAIYSCPSYKIFSWLKRTSSTSKNEIF
jgi:hypothetical protein